MRDIGLMILESGRALTTKSRSSLGRLRVVAMLEDEGWKYDRKPKRGP